MLYVMYIGSYYCGSFNRRNEVCTHIIAKIFPSFIQSLIKYLNLLTVLGT